MKNSGQKFDQDFEKKIFFFKIEKCNRSCIHRSAEGSQADIPEGKYSPNTYQKRYLEQKTKLFTLAQNSICTHQRTECT